MHSVFLSKLTSSLQSLQRNISINTLIIVSMIFVLLLSLLIIALPGFEEQFEEDDAPLFGIGAINWLAQYFFLTFHTLGFALGLLLTTLCLQYLKAHIGEKRFVDSVFQVNSSSIPILLYAAALFDRAVFLLLRSYALSDETRMPGLRPRSSHSISFKENSLFRGELSPCQRFSNQVCSKKNF